MAREDGTDANWRCGQLSLCSPLVRILSVGNMYPPHHYGGYELVWRSAVEHLRAAGHEVRVLTTDTRTGATAPDPPYVHRELRWRLRDGEFQRLSRWARVRMARDNHDVLDRHLSDLRPQVVTWWSMGGLPLTLLESVRRRGLPAVAFVHDEWLDYGRWADGWTSMFADRKTLAPLAERLVGIPARTDLGAAATYVFVSQCMRDHALALGLKLRHTGVAHSGIDSAFLAPADEREWHWQLLYVGRLDPRKGVDTAVEALVHLPSDASLQIVGGWDRREEQRLRDLVLRVGVGDRVEFAGQRDREELIAVYGAADAVVFPVVWREPWGLVPLEAMGVGRPVVATGRGGSSEYLRDGENALLFEAGDAQALADALRRLAGDGELRARLRKHGLLTAARHTDSVFNEAVEAAIVAAGEPTSFVPLATRASA